MKKIYFILFLLAIGGQVQAQQYVQYTQFMFNKIALNPAYAGSKGTPTFSGLYRTQWMRFNGAPVSQSFSAHLPIFNERVGVGLSVHHDEIGPSNSWFYNLQYAYHVPLQTGKLSFGIQGMIRNYRIKWKEVATIHQADPLYGNGTAMKLLPNIGWGAYYYSENMYAGISMPRILRGDLTFMGTNPNSDYKALEERHTFLMAGGILPLQKQLKLKADGLIKYVPNAPLDIDLHVGLVFLDIFNIGMTYRFGGFTSINRVVTTPDDPAATPVSSIATRTPLGESLDFVLQVLLPRNLKIGLAYDYSLSQVREYSSGTYELMVEYSMGEKSFGTTNPRFF